MEASETTLQSVEYDLKRAFAACLCRELLKLGRGRRERVVAKEYLRLLLRLDLGSWLSVDSVHCPLKL